MKPRVHSAPMARLTSVFVLGLLCSCCSAQGPDADDTLARGTPSSTGNTVGGASTAGATGVGGGPGYPIGSTLVGNTGIGIGGTTPESSASTAATCATETTTTELLPVFLAFGFDRSGSMGKGDKDWHDQSLKWDPVAAATRAFFEDSASSGLSAALTFFPGSSNEDERCDPNEYATPDVAMTPLPSTEFKTLLDTVPNEDWIGGTPTLAVLDGLIGYVHAQQTQNPGRYAIVLVTDGTPQDCPDSSIESVAARAASVADTIPTYVIGVANPPFDDAPDAVTNLSVIAEAGGTGQAYLIDTGDPIQTSSDFANAIGQIRGASISCDVAIPSPPSGRTFNKEAVQVTTTLQGGLPTALVYDPSCTGQAWHYDDPSAPTRIVLCESACSSVQGDSAAVLAVDFACDPLFEIPE